MDIQNFFEKRKQSTALATLDRKFVSVEKLLNARNNITKTRNSLATDILQSAAKKRKEDAIKQRQTQEQVNREVAEKEQQKEDNPLFKNKLPFSQFLSKLGVVKNLGGLLGLLRFANPWVLGGLAVFGGVLFLSSKMNLLEGIRNAWESVYNFNIPGLPSLRDITEGIQEVVPPLQRRPEAPAIELPDGEVVPPQTQGAVNAGPQAIAYKPKFIQRISKVYDENIWNAYRNELQKIESTTGTYNIAGGSGGHYDGRYQFGEAAKIDAAKQIGVPNPGHNPAQRAAYRKNPLLQEQLLEGEALANDRYISSASKKYKALPPLQKLAILAYAHNQGWSSAVNYLEKGKVTKDGFGTPGTKFSKNLERRLKKEGYDPGTYGLAGVKAKGRPGPKLNVKGRTGDQLTVTSGYGWRWGRQHKGLDLGLGPNTPWGLTVPSKIVTARYDAGGYGYFIDAWMPSVGKMLRIAHNNKLYVKEGQNVDAGKVIGLSGSTGRSTGPHFHVEVRDSSDPYSKVVRPSRQDMKYILVDPQPLSGSGKGGPMNDSSQTVIVPMQTPNYTKQNVQAVVSPAYQGSLMDNQELMYLVA